MLDVFRLAAKGLAMDEATWRRHASPWSAYTRFLTCLPLLVLAVWSRVWLGWWALAPVTLALIWIWANPRVFPPPKNLDNWASKGVMGERIFLEHRDEIAAHHRRAASLLTAASGIGLVVLIWGLWVLDPLSTVFGTVFSIGTKAWFIDRMVWIHEDWRARATSDQMESLRDPSGRM